MITDEFTSTFWGLIITMHAAMIICISLYGFFKRVAR